MTTAIKWFAFALWLDISDRLIGTPLDALFAQWRWTQWLDGVTRCTGLN